MKKFNVLFIFLILTISILNGQSLYKDNFLEIESFFIMKDSSIVVRIKNISDSQLVFNDKNVVYVNINNSFFSDISLFSNGVSLIQPSLGDFMTLKKLKPNSIFSFTITKSTKDSLINIDNLNITITMQVIVTLSNEIFISDIINQDLKKIIKDRKLSVKYYNLLLSVPIEYTDESCINRCINMFIPMTIKKK